MVSTEDLVALGEELRNAGFKVATHQHLAAQHLLLRLAASGALPEAPRGLATFLGPIFCTSAAEQRRFPELYDAWLLARFGTGPRPPEPIRPAMVGQGWRFGWWVLAVVLVLALVQFVAWRAEKTTHQADPRPRPSVLPTQAASAGPPGPAPKSPPDDELPGRLELTATLDARQVVPQPRPWQRLVWRNVGLASLPLLVFGLWRLARVRRRPVLRRISSRTPDELREVHLPGGVRAVLPGFPMRRLAQELRRRRQLQSRELQVEATIEATLRNSGLFTPVVGSRVEPSHLVLVDRASLSDHQARLADTVVGDLLRSDVLIDGFDFDGDARLCRPWPLSVVAPVRPRRAAAPARAVGSQAIALDELLVRNPEHRVLVFADAAACFDEFHGAPAPWLTTLLEWRSPVLVTPRPPEAWGRREWALQQLGLVVLPLSQAGMLALLAIVGDTPRVPASSPAATPERGLHDQMASRWLERDSPPADLVKRLCVDLRDDLGPEGFSWLAACAAYPEVHWGITLRLGATLVPNPQFEVLLPRLARLIWFREAYMPDWLREALLDRLAPADEERAREALNALLSNLLDAGSDVPLRIGVSAPVQQESWRGKLGRFLRVTRLRPDDLLRAAPADSPLRDHVFLQFVTGQRVLRLDQLAPAQLLQGLRRDVRHLAWSPGGALLLCLLASTLIGSRLPLARLERFVVVDVAMSFPADGGVLTAALAGMDSPETSEAALWLVRWRQEQGRWSGTRLRLGSVAVGGGDTPLVVMSDGGRFVAWLRPDGLIAARDVAKGQAAGTARSVAAIGVPARLALSPDGQWLAAGNDDGALLWNLHSQAPEERLTTRRADGSLYSPRTRALAFNSDSDILAIGDGSGETLLWAVADSGGLTGPSVIGDVEGSALAFSSKGRVLATADGDAIRLWSVAATRATRLSEIEKTGRIVHGVFSPVNRLFAAVEPDGKVVLHDFGRGARLGQVLPGGEVPVVAFSSGADQIAVGGRFDGSTLWRLPPRLPLITIPVVVHVVYQTAEQNISDDQIASQFVVLNDDFRARNADLWKVPAAFKDLVGDAGIEFKLASTDPSGQPTSGITRTRTARSAFDVSGDSLKNSAKGGKDAWSPERYLNIWVAALEGGVLGYSQFPGGDRGTDGVVVSYQALGTRGKVLAQRNLGRTATVLVARYLNVRHIWGDANDCGGDDLVADTPIQAGPNYGKPTFPHITCNNGPNGDMFMNFADYVDDDAMYMFTKGQVARMRGTLNGPRSGLWKPRPSSAPAMTAQQSRRLYSAPPPPKTSVPKKR